MRTSRREFLILSGSAAAGLAIGGFTFRVPTARAFSQSSGLKKFAQPLRGVFPLDASGIPVAGPDGSLGINGATHYRIDINQYTDTLHPDLGPTTLRGYQSQNNLGGP